MTKVVNVQKETRVERAWRQAAERKAGGKPKGDDRAAAQKNSEPETDQIPGGRARRRAEYKKRKKEERSKSKQTVTEAKSVSISAPASLLAQACTPPTPNAPFLAPKPTSDNLQLPELNITQTTVHEPRKVTPEPIPENPQLL